MGSTIPSVPRLSIRMLSQVKPYQTKLLFLIVMISLGACSVKDESRIKGFISREASGQINGTEWSYQYAYVDPTIKTLEEDDYVFILLPYQPEEECPQGYKEDADNRTVMVSAPKIKKRLRFKKGSARSAVFQYFDSDGEQVASVARRGMFQLKSTKGEYVAGRLVARLNSKNYVNGSFKARLCDYRDFRN